jgi:uncharacterized repeat protein (TIGR01451 family)
MQNFIATRYAAAQRVLVQRHFAGPRATRVSALNSWLLRVKQTIARSLLGLLALFAFAAPASAAITFTLNTGNSSTNTQKLLMDSNSCTSAGPRAAYVGGLVTNTGASPVTGITAAMSGLNSNIYFAGGQPASQTVGTLGAGESVGVYWFVGYNCVDGATAVPSIALTSSLGSQSASVNLQIYKAISANAGGLVTSANLGLGAVVGQIIDLEVSYSFGGTSVGDEFFLQPAGNQSFNAACFRLVSSQILPPPTGQTAATAVPVGTVNKLYFLATASQTGTGKYATVKYRFLYLCANQATSADSYAAQTSGNTNIKYTGNFGSTPITYPAGSNPFTISKSVSPTSRTTADPAGALTYTVTVSNPSAYGTYLDRIDDQLPTGISYVGIAAGSDVTVANSSTSPSAGATGLLRFTGKVGVSYYLAPGGSVRLIYTANPPATVGTYINTAQAFIGSSSTPTVSATFTLTSVLTAVNDSVSGVNGTTGATNVVNAFTGDTVGAAAASVSNATLTLASGSTVPAGLTFDTATGNVSVAASTPAGTYSFNYQICEIAAPTNCRTATVTVTVVAPQLSITKSGPSPSLKVGVNSTYVLTVTNSGTTTAVTARVVDQLPASLGFVSATGTNWACANVSGTVTCNFSGGTIAAAGGTSTISVVVAPIAGSGGTSITNYAAIDPTGGTVVPTPGPTCAPAGSCASAGPSTILLYVVVANDDTSPTIDPATGGTAVADVLGNDTLNGASTSLASTVLSVVTPATNAGVALNTATGAVTVAPGTPGGTYTITYRLCHRLDPGICDDAVVTVIVGSTAIVATSDNASGINGAIGAANVLNVLGNDTLAGLQATVSNVTITVTAPASHPGVTLNTATGNASVAAGTPAGTYTIGYRICEIANSTNCADSVATIIVYPSGDLTVTKSNGVSAVTSGSTITYTVVVSNNGPDAITGAVVTDMVGAGLTCPAGNAVTITGAGIPAGSYTISNLTGSGIALGTLASGQSAILTYTCGVN